MPQIIVTAGDARDPMEGAVMLCERINVSDFDSDRFAQNLIERLGWAVTDAAAHEQDQSGWSNETRDSLEPSAPAGDTRELVKA